jgi:hypothetical protein
MRMFAICSPSAFLLVDMKNTGVYFVSLSL